MRCASASCMSWIRCCWLFTSTQAQPRQNQHTYVAATAASKCSYCCCLSNRRRILPLGLLGTVAMNLNKTSQQINKHQQRLNAASSLDVFGLDPLEIGHLAGKPAADFRLTQFFATFNYNKCFRNLTSSLVAMGMMAASAMLGCLSRTASSSAGAI